MPVLVASKFEEDLIENKHHFFHHSRAGNSKMIDQIWPYLEFVQDFMPVMSNSEKMDTSFPPI